MASIVEFLNYIKKRRGGVFVEFALLFPLLIGLLMGIYDFTRAINRYFLLSRLAYEGTRLATSYVGLENGSYDENNAPSASIHRALQNKIRGLVTTYSTRINAPAMLVSTSYNNTSNVVQVTVRESYQPLFFGNISSFPISASVEGPYLLLYTELPTPTATPLPASTKIVIPTMIVGGVDSEQPKTDGETKTEGSSSSAKQESTAVKEEA